MEPDLEVRQLISCMTFHGFALKMANHYGKSRYAVDENFEIDTVRKIISRKRFRNQINPEHAQDIVDINEAYRGKKTSITKVLKNYPKLRGHQKLIDQIIRKLERAKEKAGVISPSDSVRLFMRLVNSGEISPSVLHKEFGAVAVDEFQDTLAAQWEMIKVVVGPKTRLLAAGDPGQCIFTWAGASLKRFHHFKDSYPQHEVHRLTRNYRSTTQILDFCNSVLSQSTLADVTKSRSKVSGPKPTVVLSPSPPKLCEYAAKEISKARDSGQPLSEIAVLYRFHNDKRILTGHLENARIPYQVYQKHKRMDRPIIKLIAGINSILQGIIDREPNQSIWEEPFDVLKYVEGVGKSNSEKIATWLRQKKRPGNHYSEPLRFQKPLSDFLGSLDRIASNVANRKPPARLKAILGLVRRLPKVNQTDISKELATLFRLAYQSRSLEEALDKYHDTSHPTCYPAGRLEPPFPDDYVTLATIHKAKGSEFSTVYYLGTDDYLYENYRCFEGKKILEEILLMNVACSRAGRKLTLLFQINRKQWESGPAAANPWTIIRKVPKDQFNLTVV